MIEVTKRHDAQFPIGVVLNAKPVQKFTLAAGKELRAKLSDAIEWAVNMDDLRKENHQESNAPAELPAIAGKVRLDVGLSPVFWEHEDELPEMSDDDFDAIFGASGLSDGACGVRVYPYVKDAHGNKIFISKPNAPADRPAIAGKVRLDVGCCGGCAHFDNEDISGAGWCTAADHATSCDGSCLDYHDNLFKPNAHLSGGTPSAPSDCSQGD